MKLSPLLGLAGLGAMAHAEALSSPGSGSRLPRRDYTANDYYILQLDGETDPSAVAARLNLVHDGCLGALDDHHIFSVPRPLGEQDDDEDSGVADFVQDALRHRRQRRSIDGGSDALDGVRLAQKQRLRKPWEKRGSLPPPPSGYPSAAEFGHRVATGSLLPGPRQRQVRDKTAVALQESVMRELKISDPIFKEQWHLINPVELGHDVNVADVWLQGVTGTNTTVAIVDDGLDMYSDDLAPNYYAEGSWDFNDPGPEPRPRLSDDHHGTRCSGEVAAARNDVCGVGVAFDARIAGLRILSKLITDADEALAMMYDMQNNDIYSCSWGPPDDGRSMDSPGVLIRRAMLKAVQAGRGGLGSVYVFASGNGAGYDDNCNFDGYTNSIYSITVGAIDRKGNHPYYSEKCSAQLVVTYSSGSGDAIHTTDVGKNNCYSGHGGTSAAAPLAAGIFALALQVRPDLSWRDMQYLALDTAVPVNEDTGEYQATERGNKFSHMWGYGKVDSLALVEAARTWTKVKPQAWYYSPWIHVNQEIPQGRDGPAGLSVAFEVTADMLKDANLGAVEHVTVTMNAKHSRRGDLAVDLISPFGVTSHIATARKHDNTAAGYDDWTFMTVAHWGETGIGKWTVVIRDTIDNEHSGVLTDWHLKLWGESIDADKAVLLPMPEDSDDKDHALTSTTTATAATQTATEALPTGGDGDNHATSMPSDHPHRPTKIQTGEPAAATTASTNAPSSSSTTGSSSSSLSSHLKAVPVWIYGAAGLIGVFSIGICVYFWRARKARDVPRDSYEFELLQDDAEKNGRRRPRGGELYDAFADGSDDDLEAELLSGGEDDGDGGHGTDRPHGGVHGEGEGSGSGSGSGSGASGRSASRER